MNTRKIIIIASAVIGIIALVLGIYFAWRSSRAILAPEVIQQQPGITGEKPIIGGYTGISADGVSGGLPAGTAGGAIPGQQGPAAKLKIISSQPVFDYWLSVASTSSQSFSVFYLNNDGKIFRIQSIDFSRTPKKDDEVITQNAISDLESVKASSNGKMAVVKFGIPTSPKISLYNIDTKIWQQLDRASAAAFSPDSKKLAYLEIPAGSKTPASNLMIKDLEGAKPKTTKLLSIYQKDLDLSWIAPEIILLVSKASYQYENEIWAVNTKTKTIISIGSSRGFMTNWSSDGKLGITFKTNERRQANSSLINNKGETLGTLDFVLFPDKCFINQPKIYCSIPQSYNSMIPPVLPDDYLKRAVYSTDAIYQIDSNQNSIDVIFSRTNPAIDAINLKFFRNQLFFINRYDNMLYSLTL